jgi:hypothetical protein
MYTTNVILNHLINHCIKGVEGIDFNKVSALKYAKTAQYLMIESLHNYLIVLSYNIITGGARSSNSTVLFS